ncbi:MAG: hypothetical protein F6K00_31185 [Leptolyngbya sp. SIOISBB]|nr:hypothetical protein [Leptolyngbya sp. SIOISBB]
MMIKKIWLAFVGVAAAVTLSMMSLLSHAVVAAPPLLADAHMSPSSAEVCAIVTSMPNAENTDEFLSLLDTSRQNVITDLEAMRSNMMQYDAEGYGWQNIIDNPGGLAPQPGAWLLGAVRIACESQAASAITGTVTYRERIALPPDATVVVTLEDVSRADTHSTVIAGDIIHTSGQQVPIPYSVTYDPADIVPQNRYVVRAQIFYDGDLSWTSTTAYPVITQDNPTDVEIMVQQI